MQKVSVVLPAYNAAKYIARAIESVLTQDYRELELVVVNDGSTDNTEKIIRPYLGDERIKYSVTGNRGVSHAINRGLKEITGDYAAFLHADDFFLPGKIKTQVAFMKKRPSCAASYTAERYFLEGTRKEAESPYHHFSGDIFYFLKRNNFIHMSTVMFRKDLYALLKLDEGLACHEDWDQFLRLARRGVRFFYIDIALSSISVNPEALSRDTLVMDRTRSIVGRRARGLWKDFRKEINIYSAGGISSLARYVSSKIYAGVINFPRGAKFNRGTPQGIFSER